MKRPIEVTVIYKGGATVVTRCDAFTTGKSRLDNTLSQVEWENASPKPHHFGIDDVIAVWVRNLEDKN